MESLACCTTGHHAESTAYQQYINCCTAYLQPGAQVLSGNPPQERGSLTAGPRAASWTCLVSALLPEEKLEEMMEWLFSYAAETIAEPLRRDGRLRPAMRAAFASVVMHYEDRLKANCVVPVAVRLRKMMVHFERVSNVDAAHEALTAWGKQLHAAFTRDNLHMVQWKASAGGAQALAATQRMFEEVNERMPQVELLPEIVRNQADMSAAVAMLSTRVETLTRQQALMQQLLQQLLQQQLAQQAPVSSMPMQLPPAATAATAGSSVASTAFAAASPPPPPAAGVCPRVGVGVRVRVGLGLGALSTKAASEGGCTRGRGCMHVYSGGCCS